MGLAPKSQLFMMPKGGFGHLEGTYKKQEDAWLQFASSFRGGQIDLIGHSQNAVHVALFAVRHPELVRRAILVNGPFHGAPLANVFASRFHCAQDMRPESSVLEEIRDEITKTTAKWARKGYTDVPEMHFFGLKHDAIVPPDSPYMKLKGSNVFNHCVGKEPIPPAIADWQEWYEVDPSLSEPNHFTVLWHPFTVSLVRDWLCPEEEAPHGVTSKPKSNLAFINTGQVAA